MTSRTERLERWQAERDKIRNRKEVADAKTRALEERVLRDWPDADLPDYLSIHAAYCDGLAQYRSTHDGGPWTFEKANKLFDRFQEVPGCISSDSGCAGIHPETRSPGERFVVKHTIESRRIAVDPPTRKTVMAEAEVRCCTWVDIGELTIEMRVDLGRGHGFIYRHPNFGAACGPMKVTDKFRFEVPENVGRWKIFQWAGAVGWVGPKMLWRPR